MKVANATLSLNAGTIALTAPTASFTGLASLTNAGTISLVGATLTLAGPLTGTEFAALIGNGTLNATALFGNLSTIAGVVHVTSNGTAAGTSKLTTLAIAGAADGWTGNLALGNNKLVIEATPLTRTAVLATTQNQVAFGSAHAAGITSSALPPNTALAVAENGALPMPLTTFGSAAVDLNSILVGPELLGDADFSGAVDLNDLNTVLNNLGTATFLWTQGNFDHASTIDLNDLNAVLNHLGLNYPAGAYTVATAEALVANATPTPEPTSLCVLTVLPLLMLKRRR